MITGRDASRLAEAGRGELGPAPRGGSSFGLGRSKDRLASARLRRSRQTRGALGCVVLFILGGIGAVYALREMAPSPPSFVVTWPKPKISQTVSNGSTLLARRGSSFEVGVSDAEQWKTNWSDNDAQGTGDAYRWKINEQKSTLDVRGKAIATDWKRFIAWVWPAQKLQLHALAPTSAGSFRHQIAPPTNGLWLYPHIYAKSDVAWDERALQLLVEPLLAALQGTLQLSVPASAPPGTATRAANTATPAPTSKPDQPMWWIVPSFDENARKPAVPGDNGTYARLNSRQLESDMLTIARRLAAQQPRVSFKFIVRLDTKVPHATLRIAFDGKGERKGWIRRPGEPSGPLIWNETSSDLSPSLPR